MLINVTQSDMMLRSGFGITALGQIDSSSSTLLEAKHVMTSTYPIVGNVQFKDIPEREGYCAGNDGSVWSKRVAPGKTGNWNNGWRELKPHALSRGYLGVSFTINCKPHHEKLHHVILRTFVGPRPSGMVCAHYDGNPSNNIPSNLRWDTQAGNARDRDRHGNHHRGSKSVGAKLQECQIPAIRKLVESGESINNVARKYKVSAGTISHIVHRNNWKHVS